MLRLVIVQKEVLLLVVAALADAVNEEERVEVVIVVVLPLLHEFLPDVVKDILGFLICHEPDVVLLNAQIEGDLLGLLLAILCFGHVCNVFKAFYLTQLAVVALVEDQGMLARELCLL